MPALSSAFLVIAFLLAVTIGPQTRPWAWGPGLLALGISVSAAIPALWRKNRLSADFGLLAFATLVAAWFAWRACLSPVKELGQADLLLLAGVIGSFVSVRAIEGNALAERILIWGLALLLMANVAVIGKQFLDPSFSPLFRSRSTTSITGFFAHYNETANYLIASTMLVGAAALFGRHALVTRIFWLLVTAAGLAAIGCGPSRGGILGAAVGGGVLAAVGLIIGKRRKARWFPYALIAIPVVGLAIGAFLVMGWQNAQNLRQAGTGVEELLDNNCRLYFLGIALSCIGLHPLAGGGSRSFSWECFRFVDGKTQGDIITHRPELVHNELVQSATDYGLIGMGLLIGLLGTFVVVAVVRALFSETSREPGPADAWRVGGLAALAGMFTQSCFSFVFHLLPGILLLGICLGFIVRSSGTPGKTPQIVGSKILLSLAAIGCVILLLPLGWKGARVTALLWPSYFSKTPLTSVDSKTDALTAALQLWPQSTLFQERAFIYQESAVSGEGPRPESAALDAIGDYEKSELLHPYDPNPAVNRANLLSELKRDADAEEAYNRAIRLQGGMEPSFRAHFSLAKHLMQKALRQFNRDDPSPTLISMEIAAQQMEEAVKKMHWVVVDMVDPRVSVQESLGAAREANGDYKGAMEAYNFATTLQNGHRANYRAGILYGKMAASAWTARRPAEALGYFIEAEKRIESTKELPRDITPSQRVEYLTYLGETIAFLKGAKIEPLPLPGR